MEKHSLIGLLTETIKNHVKTFSFIGIALGALLVIIYCTTIKFYPSGLTIADTLFFIWVALLFGFFYSIGVLLFLVASIFWVTLFAKPINFFLKFKNNKNDIILPFPKSDLVMVLGGGLFANTILFLFILYSKHSISAIIGTLFAIGGIYTLINNISNQDKKPFSQKLLNASGEPINVTPINSNMVQYFLIGLLYISPILFGKIWENINNSTFIKMGIRQENVSLVIEAKEYEDIFGVYKEKQIITSFECDKVCILNAVDILFTGIGTNTKIKLKGENANVVITLPTKAIKLIASADKI